MMTFFAILGMIFGAAMVIVGLITLYLTLTEEKPPKKKDLSWSCGTMSWLSCTTHPFDEDGKCSYCGDS